MSTNKVPLDATALSPMYQLYQTIDAALGASCSGGTQPCAGGQLAVAAVTRVHDQTLVKLTRKINHVLAEAREKGKHRKLNLEIISVGDQVLLAWTSNEVPLGATRITDIDEINRLLGVEPRKPMHDSAESYGGSYDAISSSHSLE